MALPNDPTDNAIERLFEKLDELRDAQSTIAADLRVHIASEQAWQKTIEEKINNHVDEHKAASTVWRKGAVGAIFMLIGSLIAWAATLVWNSGHVATGG